MSAAPPGSPPPQQLSPDGRYYWDGAAWQPVPASPPPMAVAVKKRSPLLWIAACIACLIAGTICGAGIASSPSTRTASSSSTPKPAETVTVTVTATATPAPPPMPYSINGTNSKVTDPFNLDKGSYRVSWKAQGAHNFISDVRDTGGATNVSNVILPNPSSGEVFYNAPGGNVVVTVEAEAATWTITFQRL